MLEAQCTFVPEADKFVAEEENMAVDSLEEGR